MSKIETILIVEYKQIDDYKSTHNVVHSNAKSYMSETLMKHFNQCVKILSKR